MKTQLLALFILILCFSQIAYSKKNLKNKVGNVNSAPKDNNKSCKTHSECKSKFCNNINKPYAACQNRH